MKNKFPLVFISATSADLAEARKIVRDALLDMQCHPVVQEHFGTDQGNIANKERRNLKDCDAVIHIVGRVYGAEPSNKSSPRRSYTQLEYDNTINSKKPLFLFLASDKFYTDLQNLPSNWPVSEGTEEQQLQQAHYSRIKQDDRLWYEFSDLLELRSRIRCLRIKRPVYWLPWIATGLLAVISAVGIHLYARQTEDADHLRIGITKQAEEMQAARKLLEKLSNKLLSKDVSLTELSGKELYDIIMRSASHETGLPESEIQRILTQFANKTEEDKNATAETRALSLLARKLVLESFDPDEFESYVVTIKFSDWKPKFIVLRHTVRPRLTQRPNGMTKTHIMDMAEYFDRQGWSGGPHLYIDQNRIWVFNSLSAPGVHTRNWNKESFGVEMVGYYNTEPFDDRVRDNTVSAIASLCKATDISPNDIRFPRDHPAYQDMSGFLESAGATSPGRNVSKSDIISRVEKRLEELESHNHERQK